MPRRALILLLIAAALVTLSRVVTFYLLDDHGAFEKYLILADRALRGDITGRLNDVSPLYLWLIALARALRLPNEAVRVAQIAATGVVAVLCALVAARFGGVRAAAVALLAILGSQAVFLNATEFEPETLILLLNALALFFLLKAAAPLPHSKILAGGLALGASIAARPTALLAAIVLLAVVPRRRLFVAGLLIPIAIVLAVNLALTGHATVMNPGTVFYEGMNPRAEGYEGVRPEVVDELRARIPNEPDRLHVAFRIVASRALGRAVTPEEANRYWIGKALAFARAEPREALRLTAMKLFFAFHSHDAWDLSSMIQRTASLSRIWLPFGVVVTLALFALIQKADRRLTLALALVALSYVAVMAAFYVTARQRNAMLPAAAILAGIGASALFSLPRRKAALALVAAVAVIVLLTRDYAWQRENRYHWIAYGMSLRLSSDAEKAERAGDARTAALDRAHDATWLFGDDPDRPLAPRPLIASVARERLSRTDSPQRRFDLAFALQTAGDWRLADDVLRELQQRGYVPMRRFSAVRSVAFYRALAQLHLGNRTAAAEQLRRAMTEAPANEEVLALAAVLFGDKEAQARLFAIHDPLTARAAVARARLTASESPRGTG